MIFNHIHILRVLLTIFYCYESLHYEQYPVNVIYNSFYRRPSVLDAGVHTVQPVSPYRATEFAKLTGLVAALQLAQFSVGADGAPRRRLDVHHPGRIARHVVLESDQRSVQRAVRQ